VFFAAAYVLHMHEKRLKQDWKKVWARVTGWAHEKLALNVAQNVAQNAAQNVAQNVAQNHFCHFPSDTYVK
jgi:hypothetical protein